MKEIISIILQIITVDFFIAFGLYTLLYLVISIFTKNPALKKTDTEANKFISFIGIVYFITWIAALVVFYIGHSEEGKNGMLDRMFGRYWFGFWLQPIVWISITQLLRKKAIRENVLLRIVFSLFLIISIEAFVILITSFHRDYLPSSYRMHNEWDIFPSNFFLSILIKIIAYVIFVGVFYLIRTQLQTIKQRTFRSPETQK